MVASAALDPIDLLRRMEQAIMDRAPRLPEETQGPELWTGVGFRLADVHLVTPLEHIAEVLPYPALTPVPGTKSWVRGVANVRGNLLTIVDLAEYFGKGRIYPDERTRVLTMNIENLHTGLVVNEVFGLRHFNEESERQRKGVFEDAVTPHLQGAFLRDDVLWGMFDMYSLAASATFMHVAA
jgi:twitching motility protein PilI